LLLTYNVTSLILPGNANITTAANDTAEFLSLGSGNWICLNYSFGAGSLSAALADFTIIYPNGGSSASPATAAANSRYVTTNPFPGFNVLCKVELLSGGEWIEAGWQTWREPTTPFNYLSAGARSTQHNSGDIVVVTGTNQVLWTASITGQSKDTAAVVSAPVRVKVWKIKG
jgi:hypothetical protein